MLIIFVANSSIRVSLKWTHTGRESMKIGSNLHDKGCVNGWPAHLSDRVVRHNNVREVMLRSALSTARATLAGDNCDVVPSFTLGSSLL